MKQIAAHSARRRNPQRDVEQLCGAQEQLASILVPIQRIRARVVLRLVEQRYRARIGRRQQIYLAFDVLANLLVELTDNSEINSLKEPVVTIPSEYRRYFFLRVFPRRLALGGTIL